MGKIYKVWHTLNRGGKDVSHFTSDLIFVDGIPIVVLEWDETPEGDVPVAMVRLEAEWLQQLHPPWPNADYIYEMEVDDPRELS